MAEKTLLLKLQDLRREMCSISDSAMPRSRTSTSRDPKQDCLEEGLITTKPKRQTVAPRAAVST